jgi:hypothetical protein
MSRRTIIVLVVVLVGLIGAAVLVQRSGRPQAPEATTLASVSLDQINQIEVAVGGATTTLKFVDQNWRVAAPFDDLADAEAVGRLLEYLRDMSLGSVLSENPSRHANYGVNESSATRLTVYVKGKEAPALDCFVGKDAPSIKSVFVREVGSPQVRTLEGITGAELPKNPEVLRSPRVVTFAPAQIKTLSARGVADVDLESSTVTWTNARTKRIVSGEELNNILDALLEWRAYRFMVAEPSGAGFEKPLLTIDLSAGGAMQTVTVGGAAAGEFVPARYVRTSDRATILVVPQASVDRVVAALKKAI